MTDAEASTLGHKMEWTKGKDLHIPDTLSRAYLKESKDASELDEEIECHVNAVLEEILVSQQCGRKSQLTLKLMLHCKK